MEEVKIKETIAKLKEYITNIFKDDSTGHDIYHLERTMNVALKIQEKEGGNRFVIAISAYLHDIHRILSTDLGRYCSPKESLPKVEEILDAVRCG